MSSSNKCDEFAELLDAYHDGELSEPERRQVEEHLAVCSLCQNKLGNLASLSNQLSALPLLEPSRDIVGSMEFDFDFDFEPAFEFGAANSEVHGGERLDAYHDGELSKAEALQLERHVASCSDCAQKLAQIERVVHNVKQIPKLVPGRDIVAGLDFNCQPVVGLLDAYHDGELDAVEKQQVDAHLAVCSECSSVLTKTSRIVGGLKALPILEPARDIVASLNIPSEITANTLPLTESQTVRSAKVVPLRKSVWAGLGAVAAAAAVLIFAVSQKVIVPVDVANNTLQHSQAPDLVAESKTPPGNNSVPSTNNDLSPSASNASIETATDTSWPIDARPNMLAEKNHSGNVDSGSNNAAVKSKSVRVQNHSERTVETVQSETKIASAQDAVIKDTSLNELASLETNEGVADALGIATDEDGLYDIKI